MALDDYVTLLCSGPPKPGKLTIRSGTYVNRFTMFDASERIEVGRNCLIGPFCYITDHDHAYAPDELKQAQALVAAPVLIEDDVWLGAGVKVLKGVRIGKGAVVGAGSVVTRDVAPSTKVAGVPAKVIL